MVWLIVVGIYSLGWSALCPDLSDDMKIFMGLTISLSFFLTIVTFYRKIIFFRPLAKINMRSVKIWAVLLWLLFIIEIAVAKGTPLLSYALGTGGVTYNEFGLPYVHVIVVNGLTVLSIYCYYAVRSKVGTKKDRRILRFIAFSALVCFLLQFNRGALMAPLIGFFLIALLSTRRPWRLLGGLTIGIVAILMGFGYLGEMRAGEKGKRMILDLGKASTEFRASGIPDEFFWAYIYISTPLANAQNTVNHSLNSEYDTDDISALILSEMTPEIISKRISGEEEGKKKITLRKESILLENHLTASSVYGRASRYMGWTGLWVLFGFTLFFIYFNMKLVDRKSQWYLPMFITLDLIVLMNVLDNMFVFMGMVPQVFIILVIYFYGKATKNMRSFSLRTQQPGRLFNPDLLLPLDSTRTAQDTAPAVASHDSGAHGKPGE